MMGDDRILQAMQRALDNDNARTEACRNANPVSRKEMARLAVWLRDVKENAKYRPIVIEDD